MAFQLDTSAYLERIGFVGTPRPDEMTLRRLHRLHLLNIPIETLDFQLRQNCTLDEEVIFEKIVSRRRGGGCSELNVLFGSLLRTLGYEVDYLGARICRSDGLFSEDCDHMCLRVQGQGTWLADVGIIHFFREPLMLIPKMEQHWGAKKFRIVQQGDVWFAERWIGGRWTPEYNFELAPRAIPDFQRRLDYHQTSLDSPFMKHRICARETTSGYIMLWDFAFRTIADETGQTEETMLTSEAEFADVLREHFGVELPVAFPSLPANAMKTSEAQPGEAG